MIENHLAHCYLVPACLKGAINFFRGLVEAFLFNPATALLFQRAIPGR